MKIMDCTLRDGGYNCQWNFDINLVNNYLKSLEKSNIEAVEIGFKTVNQNKDCGMFGKLTDEFINENLNIPNIEFIGVMINSKEYDYESVKRDFKYVYETQYNLVRIATYYKDIEKTRLIARCLKGLGYIVSINLMQSSLESYHNIFKTCQYIQSWDTIDILYLADSLGNMSENDIINSYEHLKKGWKGKIGFHGHNNKNNALVNSLEAVDNFDIDFVDSTMIGMGRGAGNTQTEYLILELNKRGYGEYDINPIISVMGDFYKLKNELKWGSNIFYYLAADYNIHPTYVQTMIERKYNFKKIIKNIGILKNKNMFDKNILGKKQKKLIKTMFDIFK